MKKLFLLLLAVIPAIAMQDKATNPEYLFLDAIMEGDVQEFQKILPKINIESSQMFAGKSALIKVLDFSIKTHPQTNKLAMILLESGARVNTQDCGGGSALNNAAVRANSFMVAELLRRGANPNLKDNQYGNALLSTICVMGAVSKKIYPYPEFIKVIKQLLQAGTDPNTRGFNNKTAFAILRESRVYHDLVHDLSQQQKAVVCELLRRHGARE